MNNNFVVSIPKEMKQIQAKLFFGLTKRQLIGFGIAITVGFATFLLLKNYDLNIAMYGLFFTVAPIFFVTIYSKDGMYAEQWIKLYLEYNYLNPSKRYFKVSKANAKIAEERNMLNVKEKVKKTKPISSSSTANR